MIEIFVGVLLRKVKILEDFVDFQVPTPTDRIIWF